MSAILNIAVAEAPYPVPQTVLADAVAYYFSDDASFNIEAMRAVFDNAGIERRTFALPMAAYIDGFNSETRNSRFLEAARPMLLDVAGRAVPPELRKDVTHVVTLSTSGIAAPSLECDVMQQLGINPNARRVPVFGLGCAGGTAGLQIARDLAASSEDALVLLLVIELTSLTLLPEDPSRTNFVACALFGDGAAGVLVGHRGKKLATLGQSHNTLFSETQHLMGWNVRETGWQVLFSTLIPGLVRREIRKLVGRLIDPERIRHYVLHPGGAKILEGYRSALGLSEEQIAPSADVLRTHGNMSAATVLFILDRLLKDPERAPGPALLTGFGPGFSADVMLLDVHAR